MKECVTPPQRELSGPSGDLFPKGNDKDNIRILHPVACQTETQDAL